MQEQHYTIPDHSSTECGRRFVFNNGWQPLLEGTEEIDLQRCDERLPNLQLEMKRKKGNKPPRDWPPLSSAPTEFLKSPNNCS